MSGMLPSSRMALEWKRLEDLSEADISSLVSNSVPERRTVEYKRQLPTSADADRKEFLADLSSFANAGGGHIIFGIDEEDGIPTKVVPLVLPDVDSELLKLEGMIRDGITPRMVAQLRAVPVSPSGHVLVIVVPRSWASPHMVTFKGHGKFYARNSAGKYAIDVTELRRAFTLAAQVGDEMRLYRRERLAALMTGDFLMPMAEGAKIVLHVCPFSAFGWDTLIDVRDASRYRALLHPLFSSGTMLRYNIDGLLTYAPFAEHERTTSYMQLIATARSSVSNRV